jgi:hypothetical protein
MKHPDDIAIVERDLRAVDAALDEGAAGHDDPAVRELQELALALRADASVPDRSFAAELARRVETGFPDEPARRVRRIRLTSVKLGPMGRVLAPLGVVAPLLVIVVVVIATGGPQGGGDEGGGGSVAGGGAAEQTAPDAGARQSGGGSTEALQAPPVPGTGFAPKRHERRIERSIAMTLSAPDDEIPALAEGVNRVTARHGGFVLSSDLDTGDEGATGSYELRIPANRLQSALRGLARLGTVSSQSQSGQDVTRDFVTAADRLQSARAERRSLLHRLEEADSDERAEAIRVRLDLVAGEINGLRSRLHDLRLRTDYAIVSVDLVGEDADSGAGAGTGSFDDAVGDAGDLLVGFAGVLIRVLAIAVPLALIAGLGWIASAVLRRRRRESALA